MHTNNFRFFLGIIVLLQSFLVSAQEINNLDYKNTPLKKVLTDIEQETGILFSYSDELISKKTISKDKGFQTISELLVFLGKVTGLEFERISENQVIISSADIKTSVCGYLFDAISKVPLAYATIMIKSTNKGYTTDDNGYFNIENEVIENGLLIQYIGYSSLLVVEKDFEKDACKNIFLTPKAESLSEVVVRSYLIKGIDKNKDGSLTITSKNQGILPGLVEPDIFQSVQWVPGITSINETVSDIQIRGGSADQNLILYDGIKLYNTGHFFGMLSIFNPYLTTKVTILKGGVGPEYGDRISGVIDIKGDTQIPERTELSLGLNGTQANTFTKIRLGEKVGFILSGRRSYADIEGFGTPTFDAISEKVFQNTIVSNETEQQTVEDEEETLIEGEETFFFYDTNAKLIFKPSKLDSIYISALLTRNDLNFSLRDEENVSRDILTAENQGLSFNWAGIKGNHWHHSLEGYYSNYESNYRNLFLEEQNLQEESIRRNEVEDYGFDMKTSFDFNKGHSIGLGYQFSKNKVFYQLFRDEAGDEDIDPEDEDLEEGEFSDERDFNEVSNRKNTTSSIYGSYSYRPENRGLVTFGLRASRFSLFENWYFEPRLNVAYPINKSLRLKFTGEKRYQTLSQLVEFDDTRLRLQSGIWSLTEDRIPLLESEQFSTGLLFDFEGWIIDVDMYFKNIDGLTSFTNGFTNASEEYSQGMSDIFGIDALLKKQLGNYRIWLGYTYNTVDYRFEELDNGTFAGNNDITHNLTLSNTYEKGNWKFSLGWNFRTGVPFTPLENFNSLTGDITFGDINSARLPNYHRLDASILYSLRFSTKNSNKVVAGLSFQNIYARQTPLSVFYRVDDNPQTGLQEIDQLEQLSLGFTPNFLLQFNF